MAETSRSFSPEVQAVIDDCIPICRKLAGDQRYAISVSGSLGKGTWDGQSDVDFRLFTDSEVMWIDKRPEAWEGYFATAERWKQKGILIDGIWWRTIGEIDAALDGWLNGELKTIPVVWTIWGYHILPDIYNQFTLEDPYQVIAGWKHRLSIFSPKLKAAILEKYLGSLRYWRTDYHYQHKVGRGDIVFLAGMSAKLVHEIIQVLFALNETYFLGDGSNLNYVDKFKIVPPDFTAKVQAILYPQGINVLEDQYAALGCLIDEVIALAG